MSQAREFWISECCELPPPVPYVDKDVDDLILLCEPGESDRTNWVHVIEKSAYDKAVEALKIADEMLDHLSNHKDGKPMFFDTVDVTYQEYAYQARKHVAEALEELGEIS